LTEQGLDLFSKAFDGLKKALTSTAQAGAKK
jgi:hypothetical protein